ncbi:MAG: 16S rRNA maturation RNase [Candidatus Phytoplasma cynodontis]|uniref:rRNA maturation RNase YbeY n=1 Tax='Cynodon dactylon' phytoplasma TaxID=295320 RepID=UPI001265B8A9|nr:rRNA maturation RNase YbeY ['Cynodon dactylon' phytoplasma]KAB8121880.1 rRNA maturation RNase YbeY ['Cynodon dactylon' phytoplasma]WIA07793.1 MAG: 16S rRNA maturation RNase [Candidatus Phytoplasma cynodontis]
MEIKIHNQTKMKIYDLKSKLFMVFNSILDDKKMHIIFIENEKMQKMNFYYRNKNYPTDILTFINEIDDDSLGDVFISLTEALLQADHFCCNFIKEVCFLSLHGYLHLKGYKDENYEELNGMINIQNQILSKYIF